MSTEIKTVVDSLSSLARPDDVNQAYVTVDRYSRESRTSDLVELATAIEDACDVDSPAKMAYEAVADHVEEVLALTRGGDHLDALLALLAKDRVRSVTRPRPREVRVRAFASKLGHGQTKDALVAAVGRFGAAGEHVEILACWMHELVLRGTALDRDPAIVKFHAQLGERKHPLGAMPLRLLEAESEAPTYMPMYGANAISKAVARLESGPTTRRTIPPAGDHIPPSVTRAPDAAVEARLLAPAGPWTASPAGKAEAKVYRLDPPLEFASPGRWLLRALSLDCVEGSPTLWAERAGADAVWGALFAAAANGGAWSAGLGGAYGRSAAWASLGAFVDAPADATPPQIDERAPLAQFLMFGASGGAAGWWNDIAWDLGVLAVRPGGGSVAVLAATDGE